MNLERLRWKWCCGLLSLVMVGLAQADSIPDEPWLHVSQWQEADWSLQVTHISPQAEPDAKAGAFAALALEADGQPAPAWQLQFAVPPAADQQPATLGALLLHTQAYDPAKSGALATVTVEDQGKVLKGQGRIICRVAVVQAGRIYTSLNENFEQQAWTDRTVGPLQARDFGELDLTSTRGDMNRKSNPDFSANAPPLQFGIWRMLRTGRKSGLTYHEAIDEWRVILKSNEAAQGEPPAVQIGEHLRQLTPQEQRDLALAAVARFNRDYDERRYLDRNDNRALIWNESKLLQGYAWAFEADGQRVHLDRLFAHAREVWARRSDRQGVVDEVRNRLMPAWCTDHYTAGRQHAMLVGAGMLTYPMLHAAYLSQRDPQLAESYAQLSRQAVLEAIESLEAFEYAWRDGPAEDEGYYKDFRSVEPGKALRLMEGLQGGPNAGLHVEPYDVLPLPFNMQNAVGRSYVMLWLLTGEKRFATRAERLARFFKRRLQLDGDAYVWPYGVHRDVNSAEDTSHAGLNIEFVVLCHRVGLVFDQEDISRFCATARRVSLGAGGLRSYIDGSGNDFHRAPMLYGWLGLGMFDAEFRLRALAWYEADWATGGSREGQAGAGALAASTLEPMAWQPVASPLPIQ